MKRSSLKRWCFLALLFFLQSWAYAQVDAGYEADKGNSTQCPNATGSDAYGGSSGGFAICNCTSYVAYRLRLNGVKHNGNNLFVNHGWGGTSIHWSDAWKWGDDTKLEQVGVRKDQYPAVGSVAYWDTSKIPGTGHVAYVQHLFTNKVSGKLDAIGVMEYNWADCPTCGPDKKYRYRKISPGRGTDYGKGSSWPTAFLHFEEKGTDADNTNVTCTAGLDKSAYKPSGANDGTFCWKHTSNSDASCGNASDRFYLDYQTCMRYSVSSSYCNGVGNLPGYTAKVGSGSSAFPESIAPSANGNDFASCPSGSTGTGTSNLISGSTSQERAILWRDIIND